MYALGKVRPGRHRRERSRQPVRIFVGSTLVALLVGVVVVAGRTLPAMAGS